MLPARSGDSSTGSRPHRTLTFAIFHLAIVSACLAVLSASRLAWSAEAYVQWDAVADPRVVLYELHWGVSSGQYQWTVDALSSSTDISDLQEGETYYFAVRACPEERSLCSAFSTELAESVPYAQPEAGFEVSPAVGVAPLTVSFTDTSSGEIDTHAWNFGDDAKSTQANPNHTYTVPGTYTVSLIVTGPGGSATAIKADVVSVSPPAPVADFEVSSAEGVAPLTVSFTDTSSGEIDTYAWNFGDGAKSTQVNPTHTYTVPGTYTVSLTATGPGGSDVETKLDLVHVTAEVAIPIEVGELTLDDQWLHVDFEQSFSDPIVIVGPLSGNGSDPAVVRVESVDADGFSVRVQEWDYLDGGHVAETVSYLAIERGIYQLPNGVWIEANRLAISTDDGFFPMAFAAPFVDAPVVITATSTYNEADAVTTRVRTIDPYAFEVKLQEQEASDGHHTLESIDYVAWEPSAGELEGLHFEAGRTAAAVTEERHTIVYASAFDDPPLFLADMQTTDGSDTANLRCNSLTNVSVDVWVDEEQSKNSEINHTAEVVGYLLLAPEPGSEPQLSVIYEDGEDGDTLGWSVYDNSPAGASISNVIDPDSGDRVIAVNGAGLDNGYKLQGEDGQPWGNDTHHVISWDMKYSEDFHAYVDVETSAGRRYLEYTPTTDPDRLGDGQYVHHSLDVGLTDGSWQRVERDLAADLADAQPGVELLQVNAFLIRGSGLLDNIGMGLR